MAAPSRVSYRHFLYPAANRAVLLASQAMTPKQSYQAQVVQTDAPAPVDATFQSEETMYDGRGPLDIGDLVMALGNFLPQRYTAASKTWDFLWEDNAKPTGWNDPQAYNKMQMYSRNQQCYEMGTPTLQRLQLDFRRQGESLMTSTWLAQALKKIARPTSAPTPNPVTQQKIIRNHQWKVEHSANAHGWSTLAGVIRTTFNIPNFREGVYSMTGSDASWDEIAQTQVAPMISVYMLVNFDWADDIFGQDVDQYLRISGGSDFTLTAHGKKSNQDPFTLDGSKKIVKADFTLTATYAPGEPESFTSAVVASPNPTTTRFSVTPGDGTLFAVDDTIDVDGEEATISAISTDRITLSSALMPAPTAGDAVTRLPAWPRHRWASFQIKNTPHTSLT